MCKQSLQCPVFSFRDISVFHGCNTVKQFLDFYQNLNSFVKVAWKVRVAYLKE